MHSVRLAVVAITAFGMLAAAPSLHAQARTPQARTPQARTQMHDPNAVDRHATPLEEQIEGLRQEVRRLQAAIQSLNLTVKANHAAYVRHQHSIPGYGTIPAKSINPNASVSDGTKLLFTGVGVADKATGLPDSAPFDP